MIRHLLVSIALTAVIVGCKTERDDPWFSPGLSIDAVDTVTIVASSYALDGGTTSLFLVTGKGEKCIVRLNQHELPSHEDPGRLFFNDQRIEIRSLEEAKTIALLRAARLDSVASFSVTHGEDISGRDGGIVSEIDINGGDFNDSFGTARDSIVQFVESDEYVAMAKRGEIRQ